MVHNKKPTTSSQAKKEVSPEKLLEKWLKKSQPKIKAEMHKQSSKDKGCEYILEVFPELPPLKDTKLLKFNYKGSDPDSVAKQALADLESVAKNDKERPPPHKLLQAYVKNKYRCSGFDIYEQKSAPNKPERSDSGKEFYIIVGKASHARLTEEQVKKYGPRWYHWVLAYQSGTSHTQVADRVFADIRFKEMNDMLWVNALKIKHLEKEKEEELKNVAKEFNLKELPKGFNPPPLPKNIEIKKSFKEILSENYKTVGNTFYLSALLMTPADKKVFEDQEALYEWEKGMYQSCNDFLHPRNFNNKKR